MANYAAEKPGLTEAALTARTPAGGALTDTFNNDGKTGINWINTGAEHVCTVAAAYTCDQGSLHSQTVTIPATTGNVWSGPYPIDQFGTTPVITWGAVITGVTFKVLSLAE